MEILQLLLKLTGLTVLSVMLAWWFEPLRYVKEQVWAKLNFTKYLEWMFCSKCTGFWLTLAVTFNPYYAGIVALTSYLLDNFINNLEESKINQDG